ncbi:MAG: putative transcriptional regulator [Oleispira sp.]|jgi:putative transcriptional regulator
MTSTQALGSLKNHFLIAMPALKDSAFEHSITYICSHDSNGAMGIVLNQSTDLNLQEVLEQLEIEGAYGHENSVLLGGPVHQDHGFILHLEKGDWRSTLSVTDDIHVSTSKDILTSLAQGEGPKQYKVALGYAGWEAGQLEQELLDNSWITVAANTDIIFNTPENEMYKAALKLLGIDEGFLSSDAGHA